MNGSKPYGPSGDQQTSVEVAARFAQRMSPFPSPRPSPSGIGRMLRWPSAKPSAVSAQRTSRTTEAAADCSLSPWERERVRGIGVPFNKATRTIPGLSNSVSPPAEPEDCGGFATKTIKTCSHQTLRSKLCERFCQGPWNADLRTPPGPEGSNGSLLCIRRGYPGFFQFTNCDLRSTISPGTHRGTDS